jgi:hypothetical protein
MRIFKPCTYLGGICCNDFGKLRESSLTIANLAEACSLNDAFVNQETNVTRENIQVQKERVYKHIGQLQYRTEINTQAEI